jgi:hypothetical protein
MPPTSPAKSSPSTVVSPDPLSLCHQSEQSRDRTESAVEQDATRCGIIPQQGAGEKDLIDDRPLDASDQTVGILPSSVNVRDMERCPSDSPPCGQGCIAIHPAPSQKELGSVRSNRKPFFHTVSGYTESIPYLHLYRDHLLSDGPRTSDCMGCWSE